MRTRARGDSRNAEIGQRIRAARLRLGWTQVDLAGLLGVSYQQVNKYEKGVNSASGLRLLELGDRLGVRVGWLVGENDAADAGPLLGAGRLETKALAVFSQIEDRAVQMIALRALEALATVRRTRRPDKPIDPAVPDGTGEDAIANVGADRQMPVDKCWPGADHGEPAAINAAVRRVAADTHPRKSDS